jgi:hypothetical protein
MAEDSEWVWIRHPNLPDSKPARVLRDAFNENWGLARKDDQGNAVPPWEIVDDAYGQASEVLNKNVTDFGSLTAAEKSLLANSGVDVPATTSRSSRVSTAIASSTGGDV